MSARLQRTIQMLTPEEREEWREHLSESLTKLEEQVVQQVLRQYLARAERVRQIEAKASRKLTTRRCP